MQTDLTNTTDAVQRKQAVAQAIERWNQALEAGDIETLVDCVDPQLIMCNERQPTLFGRKTFRQKYGPKFEAATLKPTWKTEHMHLHHDIAIVVGHWTVEATAKSSGERHHTQGRLVLVCFPQIVTN